MAVIIPDFFYGETYKFDITIYYDSLAQDIRTDQVTATLKKNKGDTATLLTKNGNVAGGQNGVCTFTFSNVETRIEPETYFLEIVWKPNSGGEYVVYQEPIKIKRRL